MYLILTPTTLAGADPREFGREYEAKLQTAELEAIEDYIAESENLKDLHGQVSTGLCRFFNLFFCPPPLTSLLFLSTIQIKECDAILASIEELLGRYQSDLGNVSNEIRTLQEQSQSMGIQLRNRKAVQQDLSNFIERVAVPPSLIRGICEADVTGDEFAVSMDILGAKLKYASTDETIKRSSSFRDAAPELERLRLVTIGRCRELLMDRIFGLRKARTNIQIKQDVLLKHKRAAAFLKSYGGVIYTEVRAAYIEKVSGKMVDVFRSYWAAIQRLEEVIVTASDLLGAPELTAANSVSGMFSMLQKQLTVGASPLATTTTMPMASPVGGSNSTPGGVSGTASGSSSIWSAVSGGFSSSISPSTAAQGNRAEVFALRDRENILAMLESQPLVLHVAEAEGQKFPFEVLFRSLSKLLMDSSAHEWLFCMEFWGKDGWPVYRETIAPVLEFVETSLATALQDLVDPLALLLCIRINRLHQLAMSRKANPALDEHFDRVNLLLWPRLKSSLDAQLDSVKQLLVTQSDQPAKLHPLAERYVHLATSLHLLHSPQQDAPLLTNLERLQYAVMDKLLAMSRSGFKQKGRGTVFLILNFHYMASILKEAAAKGLPSSVAAILDGEVPDAPGLITPPRQRTSSSLIMNTAANGSSAENATASTDANASLNDSSSGALGPEGASLLRQIEESLSKATALYVDERLAAGMPQLVAFVKKGEAAAAQLPEGSVVPGYGPAQAAPIAADFSKKWESVVAGLNSAVARDFGATSVGRAVQQAAFTQLLLHWSRFLELCKGQGSEGAAVVSGAVTIPAIMYALKQHRLG